MAFIGFYEFQLLDSNKLQYINVAVIISFLIDLVWILLYSSVFDLFHL